MPPTSLRTGYSYRHLPLNDFLMSQTTTVAETSLLASAAWFMGDLTTRDTSWSDKEIEAFALLLIQMSTKSKSAEVKSAAKYLIKNIENIRIDQTMYESMRETLERCRTVLEGMSTATRIRFLYWILEIGRAVSQAQPKGWFSGGGDPESSERGKRIVLLSICPVTTIAKFIEEGQFNLPAAIDLWVSQHGA